MSTENAEVPVSRKLFWASVIVSAPAVFMLLMSGIMKLLAPPPVIEGFIHLGYPERISFGLGIVELVCTILYLIPRTSVLGAILVTGYFGGAVATHVRVEEPYWIPVVLGVLIWAGLYLRDPRLRVLLPLRMPLVSRTTEPTPALRPDEGLRQ